MRSLVIVFGLLILMSTGCSNNSGSSVNLEGFDTEVVNGTNVTKAVKTDEAGNLVEAGFISGGKRNGMWMTYYVGNNAGKVKTLASYSDGILNGPYYELSNRGQIEKEVNYANNKYEGKFLVYKYGRIIQEADYTDNKLNGSFKEYFNGGGLQKEITYKNGKQDGVMRYYNENGDVTVEYQYKNGEKVSGGMVEKKAEETEE